jgi:hypothetical protein
VHGENTCPFLPARTARMTWVRKLQKSTHGI